MRLGRVCIQGNFGEIKGGGRFKKGGFNICWIYGDFLVYGGLIFQGGLDFEEGNALFWHWIVPMFKIFSLRRANPPSFKSKFSKKDHLQQRIIW